jgi:hypothetical protein
MLRVLKRVLDAAQAHTRAVPGHERRQLQLAVAVLLHEARRADYVEGAEETVAAERALVELFGVEPGENAALLEQGRAKAQLLRTGKRRQARLRPPGAHPPGREIAHLLYVPNTQSVLARNRARP